MYKNMRKSQKYYAKCSKPHQGLYYGGFYLYDILEKANLQQPKFNQWLPEAECGEKD